MFKPGKNCDGFFDVTELIAQVDCVINIFKGKTNGLAQGLFMFNNAPSHLKHADDAISATKMVKSALFILFLNLFCLINVEIPSTCGCATQMGHTCTMASIH